MTSQAGEQITIIHTLSNISRSKGNNTDKLGQLIRNIFLKNHTQNVMVKLVPDPLIRNQN